jgi:hypothetical protein
MSSSILPSQSSSASLQVSVAASGAPQDPGPEASQWNSPSQTPIPFAFLHLPTAPEAIELSLHAH